MHRWSERQNDGNHPIRTADRKTSEKKKKSYIRDLWDNINCANIHIIAVPEGEERKKDIENVFEETMTEDFPHLRKETDTQVQETQRVSNTKTYHN